MEHPHDEIMELLGAYSLDAVDADERRAVEAHLRTCSSCAAEVSSLREVVASLAETEAPAPDGLWNRIVDSLEPEAPPATQHPGRRAHDGPTAPLNDLSTRRDRPRWIPLSAIAAMLVVIALVAGVVSNMGADEPGRDQLAGSIEDHARAALDRGSASALLESPHDEALRATAAIEPDGSGYLLDISLPALDDSQTYQLWGIGENAVISLGLLGQAPDVVAFHVDDRIEALAITVEVAGGVPASSNDPVVVGEIT